MYVFIFLVKVTECPPIGKIAAHSAYEMFLWYRCLIVSCFFSHLGFWSGSLSLVAPFPDLCLLVPFCIQTLSFYVRFIICSAAMDFSPIILFICLFRKPCNVCPYK